MKKIRLCLLSFLLILLALPVPLYAAQAPDSDEHTTLAPYFYVEGADPTIDSFPLKATNVVTNINGVIAETFVTQTYMNEGTRPLHANYVFPASTKVSVHGMKMIIGDKVITAQIREREEAKQEFEAAKSEGKSASLLEQQRPNVFTMDVANIMPGDVVSIELHYTELLSAVDGTYEFVFPTVTGPRYESPRVPLGVKPEKRVKNPFLREGETPSGAYNIAVNLSAGVPITALSSPSHQVTVTRDSESTARIALSNPEDFAGNRDFILDYKLTGEEISSGLMLSCGDTENFFLLQVQPPDRPVTENIVPREYIFVLDVSGSMYGFPLDTAKGLIKKLVENLNETDHFNLILFSDTLVQMSYDSVPATAQNVAEALKLIDRQSGGGGTELAPALECAVQIPSIRDTTRSIVTITDGYLSGEKEIFEIVRKNSADTNFFSFGIGSSVNRYLIEGIAKSGSGEAFVVTDPKEAGDMAERFRAYIQSPVLTDIQITCDNFEIYDMEPLCIPALFAQKPIVLFGKWRGEPAGSIQISGKTGGQDYAAKIDVQNVMPSAENHVLSYLWARTKVERLTDYGFSQEDSVRQEVTALGLQYSMMTPYTSFIAVTDTVRNQTGDGTDVAQPVPLPLNVSGLAVGNSYTVGSEPDILLLVLAAAFLITGNFLCRRRKKRFATGGCSENDG